MSTRSSQLPPLADHTRDELVQVFRAIRAHQPLKAADLQLHLPDILPSRIDRACVTLVKRKAIWFAFSEGVYTAIADRIAEEEVGHA